LINFFKNLLIYWRFKKKNKDYYYVFFNENDYTFNYLDEIIRKKLLRNKAVLFFSLKKIDSYKHDQINLNSNFFIKLFFLTLKTKFVFTTSTDLQNSIFLKSKTQKNFYIFIQHSPVSLSANYTKKAFIEFDAVQVINKHQFNDLNDINNLFKKKIKPIRSKYNFLEKYKKVNNVGKIDFLIAPTWKTNFYDDDLHLSLIKLFQENNLSFKLRPHPMSIIKKEIVIDESLIDFIDQDNLVDFKKYKNLVSDWGGIFLEFAILNKTMPFLINTKQKILNSDYLMFSNPPIENYARKIVGVNIETNNLVEIINIIKSNQIDKSKMVDNFYLENFYT
tara:strand:- start:147 stop:1148 length:1002 start_codon:yes stop_codon:yes gene_type:complete